MSTDSSDNIHESIYADLVGKNFRDSKCFWGSEIKKISRKNKKERNTNKDILRDLPDKPLATGSSRVASSSS